MYKGTIVRESVSDRSYLASLKTYFVSESEDWHLHKVAVTRAEIENVARILEDGPWYADFYDEERTVVVFRNKVFEFASGDEEAAKPALNYGRSLGIPEDQLDFHIKEKKAQGGGNRPV